METAFRVWPTSTRLVMPLLHRRPSRHPILCRSLIDQRANTLFVEDSISINDHVTLELGMRDEWHLTPTERNDRFVVFDANRASLLRVGVDVDQVYAQNDRDFELRVGVALAVTADGQTVVHAAYASAVDQPGTTAVRDTAGNPPFAAPLTAAGSLSLVSAIDVTQPAGLAPTTIDPYFNNASVQSCNANVQQQLARQLAVTVGYAGSRRHEPADFAEHQSASQRDSTFPGAITPPALPHSTPVTPC